jgi:ubiquinone biosynthesis protein
MQLLVYVVGWTLWPLVFGALAGRLLGVRLGPLRIIVCGLAGVCFGALASNIWWSTGDATHDFVVYAFASVVGTLVAVAAVDFVARPAIQAPLEMRSRPRPLRSLHLWLLRLLRYATIMRLAWRHGLLRALTVVPAHADVAYHERRGRHLSEALEEAGGIFVKLGQVLSTRRELLPAAIAGQLEVLQDRAEPASLHQIDAILRSELGAPGAEFFDSFEDRPMAAASLGQVHRARLHSGETVAVKIQRPDVEESVQRDLDIIMRLATRLERTSAWGRTAGVTDLARGFATNLREELDYRVEARNTTMLADALAGRGSPRLPTVIAQLSTRRVLVLEWLDGVPLRDARARFGELGIDPREAARGLLTSFLTQVLEVGVFNADPHPGNVLVMPDGALAQIDFGSVGRLDAGQRLALARLLIAVERGDAKLLRDALLELTTAGVRLNVDSLDLALGQFMVQRLGPAAPAGAGMFNDLLLVLTSFGLSFDPQLAATFRALITLEGTLRVIDPDFDVVTETKQLAAGLGARLFGPGPLAGAVYDDVLRLAPMLRRLPYRIDRITADMEHNEWGINVRLLADERDVHLLTALVGRFLMTLLSGAIGLVSALLLRVDTGTMLSPDLTLAQGLGYLGLVVASLLGIRVLVAVSRDRISL